MARSRRQRKFSGTQSADPFILRKGRSVIKGFDADDGDFIGLPSDAKFKLLKRKGGVLIKGKGFRSMVKGADIQTLQGAVKISDAEQEAEWKEYIDGTVYVEIYDDSDGRFLYFEDYGQINAPSSMYENWDVIRLEPWGGELSFTNDKVVLDEGDTKFQVDYAYASGDLTLLEIDGGKGNDSLELYNFPATSRPLKPKNIETLLLWPNWTHVWNIEGEFPQMSVVVTDGGIQLSEDTVIKNVRVKWSDLNNKYFNSRVPFVSAFPGDIIDFDQIFTDEKEKLVIIPDWHSSNTNNREAEFALLSGNYKNASIEKLHSKDFLVGVPQIDEEGNRVFMEYEKDNHDYTIGFNDPKSSGEDILVELTAIPVVTI